MAIKILEKSKISDDSDVVRIERELAIMQTLKHKNIILLYEVLFLFILFFKIFYKCYKRYLKLRKLYISLWNMRRKGNYLDI